MLCTKTTFYSIASICRSSFPPTTLNTSKDVGQGCCCVLGVRGWSFLHGIATLSLRRDKQSLQTARQTWKTLNDLPFKNLFFFVPIVRPNSSVNSFFIRPLAPGVRPVAAAGDDTVIAPPMCASVVRLRAIARASELVVRSLSLSACSVDSSLRSLCAAQVLVSPADSRVTVFQTVPSDQVVWLKGTQGTCTWGHLALALCCRDRCSRARIGARVAPHAKWMTAIILAFPHYGSGPARMHTVNSRRVRRAYGIRLGTHACQVRAAKTKGVSLTV